VTRALRLLPTFVQVAFVQWLALRGFLATLVINQAITPLIGLAVWGIALPGQAVVSTYYVAILFVQLLTVSFENHTFSNRIYEGELSDDLLRPVPVFLRPLGENIAIRVWFLILAVPLLASVLLLASAHVSVVNVAIALPSMILAAFLRFLFTYVLALTAFWTQRADNVVSCGQTLIFLIGGGAAPLALMPGPLHPAVEGLPFRAMYGFPAEVAASWLNSSGVLAGYGWQIVWIILFIPLSIGTWRIGVRRYTATGG